MSVPQLLLIFGWAVLAILVVVAKKATELALEKEYAAWAPCLARLFVRLAGFISRSRRGKWWADLLYVQSVDNRSGLFEATSCLVSAPWLALRDLATVLANTGGPLWLAVPVLFLPLDALLMLLGVPRWVVVTVTIAAFLVSLPTDAHVVFKMAQVLEALTELVKRLTPPRHQTPGD